MSLQKKFRGVTVLPASGWLEVYDSNFNPTNLKTANKNTLYENNSKILWKTELPNPSNINYSSVVVSDGVLFSSDSHGIVNAFDANTGKIKWNGLVEGKTIDTDVSGRLLFIGTNKGLYALNKEKGSIAWKQMIGQIVSKPVLYNDVVIAGFLDGKVRGFDMYSGKDLWSYEFIDKPYISEKINNLVYIWAGKSFYGFDPVKNEIIWEFKTEKLITSAPKSDYENIYFGSWDGALYALNCLTGKIIWKYQTGWGIDSTPAVSGDMVYFGSLDNNFYALNKEKGELVWCFNCKSAIHSSPIIYGEYVFFGCDDGRF
ncbi:MAG: PQQ-binding-like beta-propeller repeat protein [Candidatus Thermoplasmatota archaeon]|nr:PQQ-binding-like beta-propeller repeat protein [Candidatus Thermoplasmatota archaeon]